MGMPFQTLFRLQCILTVPLGVMDGCRREEEREGEKQRQICQSG